MDQTVQNHYFYHQLQYTYLLFTGEAAAYILSKGTTFRWDTCAPHAILRAKGGDIVTYTTHVPITYNDQMDVDTQQYANKEGIIAYTESEILDEIINILN